MADTLGISRFDPSVTLNFQQNQLAGIMQLGNQLRQDLQTAQTNRQLQSFSQQLNGIDPASPSFAPQMVQAISQNPLAANSQAGRSAIGMLGSAHEAWLREQADNRNFNQQMQMFGLQQGAINSRGIQAFNQQKELEELRTKREIEAEERKRKEPVIYNSPAGTRIINRETGETNFNQDPFYVPPRSGSRARDYAAEAQIKSIEGRVDKTLAELMKVQTDKAKANSLWISKDQNNAPDERNDARERAIKLEEREKALQQQIEAYTTQADQLRTRLQGGAAPQQQAPAQQPVIRRPADVDQTLTLPAMSMPQIADPNFGLSLIPNMNQEASLFPEAAAPVAQQPSIPTQAQAPVVPRYIRGKGLVR